MTSIVSKNVETKTVDIPLQPDPEAKKDKMLFIADCDASEVAKQIQKFENLMEYEQETFANRDLQYFDNAGHCFLWMNLSKPKARDWLKSALQKCDDWTIITTFKHSKNQKCIAQLKEYSDFVTSVKDLDKIKSLTLDEFASKVKSIIKISKPENIIKRIIGCFKKRV